MCFQENEFFFRTVTENDLPQIVEIYNESIDAGNITADTEKANLNRMKAWLEKHQNPNWPAWVISNNEDEIIGYCSLNCFYPRPAYDITSEISLYIRKIFIGKKIGEKILLFLEDEAGKRNIKNLLAFVFDSNEPAMRFFSKFGFEIQARFPNLARMKDLTYRNLVIFRKTLST